MNNHSRTWHAAFFLLIFFVALVNVACNTKRVEQTPTVQPGQEAIVAPSGTLTFTLTTRVTPLPMVQLLTLEPLNIRSGPGIQYTVVGTLAAEAEVPILGRSDDGLWWQVACPLGATGDTCWVVADPLFSEAQASVVSVPVAVAPPTPTITPSPSPTRCVPTAPIGWTAYTIQPGDTLFGLAQQAGVFVGEVAAINCLSTDLLSVGSTLFLPTGAYTPDPSAPLPTRSIRAVGPLVNGDGSGTGNDVAIGATPTALRTPDQSPTAVPLLVGSPVDNLTVISLLRFGEPGGRGCKRDSTLGIQVTREPTRNQPEIVQPLLVCPLGFTDPAGVAISITTKTASNSAYWYAGDDIKGWYWSLLPGARPGVYTVTAQLDGMRAPTLTISVTHAISPSIAVLSRQVKIGDKVRVAVAGAKEGDFIYLMKPDAMNKCKAFKQFKLPALNAYGEGIIEFELLATDPDPGQLVFCVFIKGAPASRLMGLTDYRVFKLQQE